MKKLIDKDALLEAIERLKANERWGMEDLTQDLLDVLAGIEYVQDIVEHMPTVDQVEDA